MHELLEIATCAAPPRQPGEVFVMLVRKLPRFSIVLAVLSLGVPLAVACSEPASDGGVVDGVPEGGACSAACGSVVDAAIADDDAGTSANTPDGSIGPVAEDCDGGAGITLSALLTEMIDLDHLTRLPSTAYTTHLQSSHNRASDSVLPGEDGWHADQDFIDPAEGVTETLLEVTGPGVITRMWSASPDGVLRIFIDGAAEPAIEGDLEDLLSGRVAPFSEPFGFVAAFGNNLYFPIAYAESVRVTLTGGASDSVVYYHIAYRAYPEGTAIEPYSAAAVAAAQCAYERAAACLSAPAEVDRPAGEVSSFELESGAGEALAAEIAAPEGGGVVRELHLVASESAPDLLRATALVIEMDGEVTVRAPLLDFFASGSDGTKVSSLPVTVAFDGAMTARWPMPFERQARIWLEHAGAGELSAKLDVVVAAEPFTARSLYFYAGWHPPVPLSSKPPHDHVLAEAEGEGYYVGNTLNVLNPTRSWWGEGDERIYVDGEAFPSHFGTGTEDYYGYAWCSNQLFSEPYIGQTASSTHESFGAISLYRFHIIDAIPFRRALRFDLEVRHWGPAVEVTYDSMSAWYARPGAEISGARATDDTFRLPELGLLPPADVAAGPYRCGG
jgi:hypothetical protein